ncbi:MAG: FAD-dependent oxidoreductase [Acidobacteriota bacterium]
MKTCVIIGAGFAGAATAYHLARLGLERVVLLEQEPAAGQHASGRNAAMVRQVVEDEPIAALARQGAAFLRRLPEDWPLDTSFSGGGAFLLADGPMVSRIQQAMQRAAQSGIPAEWWSLDRIQRRIPVLAGAPVQGGVWCPTDGVIDIHNLLQGYLRAAVAQGAEVFYSHVVNRIVVRHGAVCAVQTEQEEFSADLVVNAAGAWASEIGRLANATPIPLTAFCRHLFVTEPLEWVDAAWPIVWDLTHAIYFRPESGGLLLSPCDEAARRAGNAATDPAVLEMLAEKVACSFPQLTSLPIRRSWAGLRTMTPDHRFVLGWDPRIRGFFWLAGLGGHGVTVSYAAGLLAAQLIRGEVSPLAASFSPNRFAAPSA